MQGGAGLCAVAVSPTWICEARNNLRAATPRANSLVVDGFEKFHLYGLEVCPSTFRRPTPRCVSPLGYSVKLEREVVLNPLVIRLWEWRDVDTDCHRRIGFVDDLHGQPVPLRFSDESVSADKVGPSSRHFSAGRSPNGYLEFERQRPPEFGMVWRNMRVSASAGPKARNSHRHAHATHRKADQSVIDAAVHIPPRRRTPLPRTEGSVVRVCGYPNLPIP